MDFGDLGQNLPFFIGAILLFILQFFLRRKRAPADRLDMVHNLLSEVRLNLRFVEMVSSGENVKSFLLTAWKLNRNRLDFIDEATRVALSEGFMIAEDYNRQVAASKKYKSPSYLVSVDTRLLKAKLTAGREGLERWLKATTGTTEPPTKAPNVFDSMMGRG